MKRNRIFIDLILCLIIVQYSFAAERVFHEDCEDTSYSEHFLEEQFGTSYQSYWNELKSEISQSSIAHSGNYSATYNPFQTGNPHARLGVGNTAYGNTSNFSLSSVNSRYWYIKWYHRWEDGNNGGANKNLYINSQPVGDYVVVLEKTGASNFHFMIKDHNTYGLVVNSWPSHSGGSLDDLEWHKMEFFIDSGTTGGNNGDYWMKIDGITLISGNGYNFNGAIHSNPIENIGWPSNTSSSSGSQQQWVDDMEIYTLTGPDDIPGEEEPVDAPVGPPGDVTNFIAQPGDGQVTLSWTNPTDADFSGTMVRYRTDGIYPTDHNDGVLVCNKTASPGSNDSFTVTGLSNGTEYRFSAFAYDTTSHYTETAHAVATPTAPADAPPTVTITQPTSEITYSSVGNSIDIGGSSSDDIGVTGVVWANNRGGSGATTGATTWSVENISLFEGENVITVTATDSNNQTASDVITVTYLPIGIVNVWSAEEQSGGTDWSDSSATWCVRLLIDGNSITQSDDNVILEFQGRTSGNYGIKKVSIAERDMSGSGGDIVDSTWTKVTFDGKAVTNWNSDVGTVTAGGVKLSDPAPLAIQAGKDYYVTFMLESPSVYLVAPSEYGEMYFDGSDHTDDLDWSGNGHTVRNSRLHTLSSIYGKSGVDGIRPRDVKSLIVDIE